MLADGQAQAVLGRLQREAEQARVVAQLDLLHQLEGDLLLGVQRHQVGALRLARRLLLRTSRWQEGTRQYAEPHPPENTLPCCAFP